MKWYRVIGDLSIAYSYSVSVELGAIQVPFPPLTYTNYPVSLNLGRESYI